MGYAPFLFFGPSYVKTATNQLHDMLVNYEIRLNHCVNKPYKILHAFRSEHFNQQMIMIAHQTIAKHFAETG